MLHRIPVNPFGHKQVNDPLAVVTHVEFRVQGALEQGLAMSQSDPIKPGGQKQL